MIKVMIPGSFDPPTNGHMDLISRACAKFDEVDVVISVNSVKNPLLLPEKRLELLEKLLPFPNVRSTLWRGLVVDYAKKCGINLIIRGIRNFVDFEYEHELATLNKKLAPEIETLFMATDPVYSVLRSSTIKEIAFYKGDISRMVDPLVNKIVQERIEELGIDFRK